MALKSDQQMLEELQEATLAAAHAQEYLVRGRSNRKARFKDLFEAYNQVKAQIAEDNRGSMFIQVKCQPPSN